MKDYVSIIENDDNSISICFYFDKQKPWAICEKINAINEDAYMNGYNWEAYMP